MGAWDHALQNPNAPVRSKEGLLKQWGAILKETSQRAFVDQSFDGAPWEPLYGGKQEPPFINIAGALADFEGGRSAPKPNRFKDRPALRDSQTLMNSMTYEVKDKTLEYGTVVEHARIHQEGGTTWIKISKEALTRIRSWLWQKKLYDKKGGMNWRKGREGYGKIWNPAVKAASGGLQHEIIRRPFVGIPPSVAQNLMKATELYYKKECG